MQEYQSPSYFYVWYRQYDNSEFYLVWVEMLVLGLIQKKINIIKWECEYQVIVNHRALCLTVI